MELRLKLVARQQKWPVPPLAPLTPQHRWLLTPVDPCQWVPTKAERVHLQLEHLQLEHLQLYLSPYQQQQQRHWQRW